jgi:nucleotide-binding universal stress UspA family protein
MSQIQEPTAGTAARPDRIVVGVDGSASSGRALEWAARQAELTGSKLEPLVSWEWPTSFGWTPPVPDDWNPAQDAQNLLDEALQTIQSRHPNVSLDPRVVQGKPALALVEASEGAALLVVGSRGHGEFAGMLLGSVSEFCVTRAHCPVLVFREDDQQ